MKTVSAQNVSAFAMGKKVSIEISQNDKGYEYCTGTLKEWGIVAQTPEQIEQGAPALMFRAVVLREGDTPAQVLLQEDSLLWVYDYPTEIFHRYVPEEDD